MWIDSRTCRPRQNRVDKQQHQNLPSRIRKKKPRSKASSPRLRNYWRKATLTQMISRFPSKETNLIPNAQSVWKNLSKMLRYSLRPATIRSTKHAWWAGSIWKSKTKWRSRGKMMVMPKLQWMRQIVRTATSRWRWRLKWWKVWPSTSSARS